MYKYCKRFFDVASASTLLVVISPLMLVLVILVRLKLGSPIFFKQKRSGKDQKPFELIKFRSMSNSTDKDGVLLPDHLRVTRFGAFLRSSSLDELPELLNIIKGDMSVIGPRPLPCEYDPYYKPMEMARFRVRGGLISPDVITNKSVVPWDEQLACEAEYGMSLSFRMDVIIFFSVFKTLFKRAEEDFGRYERVSLQEERKSEI